MAEADCPECGSRNIIVASTDTYECEDCGWTFHV